MANISQSTAVRVNDTYMIDLINFIVLGNVNLKKRIAYTINRKIFVLLRYLVFRSEFVIDFVKLKRGYDENQYGKFCILC